MSIALDHTGLKIVSKKLTALEQATMEERPIDRETLDWLRIAATSLAAVALCVVFFALYSAKVVAMPAVAGIVVGLILVAMADRGKTIGIPSGVTFAGLGLGLVATGYFLAMVLTPVFSDLMDAGPRISQRFSELSWKVESWTSTFKAAPAAYGAPAAAAAPPESSIALAAKTVEVVSPAVSQIVIFVFTTILFILSRSSIRLWLASLATQREARLAALKTFTNVEKQLADYFFAVSLINIGLGLTVGVVFLALGVPHALTWALVAALLNFLPVVGPLAMKAALAIYGFVFAATTFDAAAPFVAFLAISMIEANAITPRIIGNRITINPLLVFLSVVFWTWFWGAPGAFLAMPLLAIGSAVAAEFTKNDTVKLPA